MLEWFFAPFQFLEWIIRVLYFGEIESLEDPEIDDYVAAIVGTLFAFSLFVFALYKLQILWAIYLCGRRLYRYVKNLFYPAGDMIVPPILSNSQLAIVTGRQMVWDTARGGDGDGTVRVVEELPQIEEEDEELE